jgi:putative tricarboxylic transport membrane protein
VRSHEAAGGIFLLLFGSVTVILSLRMPIGTFRAAGTGLFPLCLGILLVALSFAHLLRLRFREKKSGEKRESPVETRGGRKQMAFFLGTMALGALFFNALGYPLTSFLLLVALLKILGVKRWVYNFLLSFVAAGVSYFLFVQWLQIPLPKGLLGL